MSDQAAPERPATPEAPCLSEGVLQSIHEPFDFADRTVHHLVAEPVPRVAGEVVEVRDGGFTLPTRPTGMPALTDEARRRVAAKLRGELADRTASSRVARLENYADWCMSCQQAAFRCQCVHPDLGAPEPGAAISAWDPASGPSVSVETTRNPDGTYSHKVMPATDRREVER